MTSQRSDRILELRRKYYQKYYYYYSLINIPLFFYVGLVLIPSSTRYQFRGSVHLLRGC